jgi:hypothetical protein
MHTAEVVIGEVQAVYRPQGLPLFEIAFVSRVNLRICILMVGFWRSTMLVQIRAGAGITEDWDHLRIDLFRHYLNLGRPQTAPRRVTLGHGS